MTQNYKPAYPPEFRREFYVRHSGFRTVVTQIGLSVHQGTVVNSRLTEQIMAT